MEFLCLTFITLIGTTVFTISMSHTDIQQENSRLISELTEQQQLITSNVADQKVDIQEVKSLIANQNTDIEKQNVRVADQNTIIQQQNNKITEVGFELKTLIAEQNIEIQKQNVKITEMKCCPPEHSCPNRFESMIQQNSQLIQQQVERQTQINETVEELKERLNKVTEIDRFEEKVLEYNIQASLMRLTSEPLVASLPLMKRGSITINERVNIRHEIETSSFSQTEEIQSPLDPTSENQNVCPTEFEQHGTSCYKVLVLKASWIEAKAYCRVLGGYLAIINSEEEQNAVNGILRRFHGKISPEKYWIDGSDILKEGDWRWMKENGESESIAYTHWARDQPDNAKSAEHCLEITNGYGLMWNDLPCKYETNFICESSIEERA